MKVIPDDSLISSSSSAFLALQRARVATLLSAVDSSGNRRRIKQEQATHTATRGCVFHFLPFIMLHSSPLLPYAKNCFTSRLNSSPIRIQGSLHVIEMHSSDPNVNLATERAFIRLSPLRRHLRPNCCASLQLGFQHTEGGATTVIRV